MIIFLEVLMAHLKWKRCKINEINLEGNKFALCTFLMIANYQFRDKWQRSGGKKFIFSMVPFMVKAQSPF